MKNKRILSMLLAISVVAGSLCGCGADEVKDALGTEDSAEDSEYEAEDESEDAAEEEEVVEEEYDEETMELIKYNIFIELNDYVIDVLNNIDAYYAVVEKADEFALIDGVTLQYGYDIHYLNTDILDDVTAAVEYDPVLGDLDGLAKEIVEPMRTMMETFNTISDAGSSFADDQYALPKELHPVIQENAENFYNLGIEYCNAVSAYASEQVAKDEEKMKEEGRLIIYYSSHALTVVKNILDEADAQGVTDYNLTDLDVSKIQPMYEELVETVNGYNEAIADNDQRVKESISETAPFDGLMDSLIQATEWMMDCAQGSGIEDPELAPLGSLTHLNDVLNTTTDRYNSVFVD